MAEKLYMYVIIPGAERVTFDVPGVERPNGPVYTVPHQGVAAVVGASPRADYRGMTREEAVRCLLGHQRVVETVMNRYPVLPVKFGTVLPDESWVRRLLLQGKDFFQATFERLAGHIQMEVVALWDVQQVFKEIAEEEPIARLKSELERRPAKDTTSERVALGRMVRAALERRRLQVEAVLLSALREVASDLVINGLMDDGMVANAALLVDAKGREALDRRLPELDERFEGRLRLRCVGPLPPYSFATVTADIPSFEAIDGARRLLGLAEKVSPGELKSAYYRSAKRRHPDHHGQGSEAEARMAELTQAWELLRAYADSYRLFRGGDADARGKDARPEQSSTQNAAESGCDLSREAVERTLLISVRREELHAAGPIQA